MVIPAWVAKVTIGLASLAVLSACVPAKVSAPTALRPLPEPIAAIGLAPSGGVLADAIGTELFGNGFQVLDTRAVSNTLVRLNLTEIELSEPSTLKSLRERGLQAILSVRTVAGYDDNPQSASISVISTQTGELLASVTWQNGNVNAVRKNMVDAAKQISQALLPQLRRK